MNDFSVLLSFDWRMQYLAQDTDHSDVLEKFRKRLLIEMIQTANPELRIFNANYNLSLETD